jgi:hypothetical protein
LDIAGSLLQVSAKVPPIFTMGRARLLKSDAGRLYLLTEQECDDQDTVAIGDIGMFPIDGLWEDEFTVIGAHVPFVQQDIFDLFQSGPPISM